MSRSKIPRSLPPLEELFHDFSGFTTGVSKLATLIHELKRATKRLRRKISRPFYPMRDLVDYLHVPLRTVALAYESLEKEGILIRIRGSKTLLAGKSVSPSKPVRAVVGIPIRLHTIVASPYSRVFYVELEERLRKVGFVADFIFYRGEEVAHPDFAERLAHHNLDFVLWHSPQALAMNALLSLKDQGVQQVLIQPTDSHAGLPLPTYLQDWQSAYRQMASAWSEAGIQRIIVPNPFFAPPKWALRAFANIFIEKGLKIDFVTGSAKTLWDKLSEKNELSSCGVIFLDQEGADAICNEDPVIIEEILKKTRVAFARGVMRIPYFHYRKAQVDIVKFSPVEMAERIARDLSQITLKEGIIHQFKATYHQNVDLSVEFESL